MTPIEALRREVSAEIDALERRIGTGPMPAVVEIRVEMDRESAMPRAVELHEDRRRHIILGGAVPARRRAS